MSSSRALCGFAVGEETKQRPGFASECLLSRHYFLFSFNV